MYFIGWILSYSAINFFYFIFFFFSNRIICQSEVSTDMCGFGVGIQDNTSDASLINKSDNQQAFLCGTSAQLLHPSNPPKVLVAVLQVLIQIARNSDKFSQSISKAHIVRLLPPLLQIKFGKNALRFNLFLFCFSK